MAEPMLPFPQMPISRAPRREPRGRGPGSVRWKPSAALLAALDAPERVVFLDVETTGLSWFYDRITMVGWARNGEYDAHFIGDDPRRLERALESASALVTFNGTLFDLRFLRQAMPNLPIPPHHVDLRYLAKRAGWTGGQKAIERLIGLIPAWAWRIWMAPRPCCCGIVTFAATMTRSHALSNTIDGTSPGCAASSMKS